MKKLILLLLFIGVSANAQFRSNLTREQYADNVDNYKPGSQVTLMVGKNTAEVAFSYTDILTWGGMVRSVVNLIELQRRNKELYHQITLFII